MIHEFQGSRPIFQPLHMKDMMDAKDGNYKLDGHTTHEPIEINEKSTTAKFGTNYDNLQTNKVYAINTNETWLYEQPQTIHVAAHCVCVCLYSPSRNLSRRQSQQLYTCNIEND
jgi:hypothetical protein